MRRSRKSRATNGVRTVDANTIVQVKVWLYGVSPMTWRRVQVPGSITLRELHGVIQVAMGWEGLHLYQFLLRAGHYGSSDLGASSPNVSLAALRMRQGARFVYEYDLNIPWRHGVRIEDLMIPEAGVSYPVCIGGHGPCPPEDCANPAAFMSGKVHGFSWEAVEDLQTFEEILGPIVHEGRFDVLDDEDTRWRLEWALERTRARERAQGKPFSRRQVNQALSRGAHRELMHQHY
jgi:Plasmid pRiA4b ORF-3-like protein